MNIRPISAAFAVLMLIWTGFTVPLYAEESVLTLEQIIEIGLNRNPGIAISMQDEELFRARFTQTYSAYLPQLTANAGYTRFNQWTANPFTGQYYRYQDNQYLGGISVSQYLYDFGQTRGLVDQSQFALSASKKAVLQTIADTTRDIRKSYFEVLKTQNLVKVNQESIRIQEEHLNQARAFFQVGVRPRIDVTKGEVEVANSRLTLIRAEYALQSSRLGLETLLGGPPLEGTYALADILYSSQAEPSPVGELVQEAISRRPEIAQMDDQIKAAQSQMKSSQAALWPTITANAGGGWNDDEHPIQQEYWQMGINISWPIFTGYRAQGKIAESRAQIRKLEASRKQLELQILNDVSTAYLGLNTSVEAIKTSEIVLQEAQENMDLADGRYRNGVGSALEYSDAELSLTQAKSNLVQASYEYYQQMADLDHAVGRS